MATTGRKAGRAREWVWADTFKAMGDRTRLSILLKLLQGEACVGDISKALKLDAPTVSFHLTKLRYSGLVVNERRGQQVFYGINPKFSKGAHGKLVIDVEGCVLTFRQ